MSARPRESAPPATPLSLHWLIEAHDCSRKLLRDVTHLESVVRDGCRAGRWTIKSTHFFHYGNGGVSGVAVLAESHLSIHTWPEHAYASLDIFVCRPDRRSLRKTARVILDGIGCRRWTASELQRGALGSEGAPTVVSWQSD